MSRSIIVTGALGKIGRRTVQHLVDKGHNVIAVDIAGAPGDVPWSTSPLVRMHPGDICDPALWASLLPQADTVIHLAAIIPPLSDHKPDLASAVNVGATEELLRQMSAASNARRLIFASSMVLAGYEQERRTPPLTVEEPPCPVDHYGRTKAHCEDLIRQSGDIDWTILRITACPSSEVSTRNSQGMEAMFSASATGRVEVVHSDDAALAFANAADCDAAIGKTLYVGGGASCRSTALLFYNRMLGAMGLGPISGDILRPGPPYFFGDWVDTEEAQALLRFQRHTLDDIIREIRRNIGARWWLMKLASPVINRMLARKSPYHSSARQNAQPPA